MYRDFIFHFSDGERISFEAAVKKYAASLTAFAYGFTGQREGAEDIVQEVFLGLWSHKPRFNDEVHLKRSLYTSVRNRSYNYLRNASRQRKYLNNADYEPVSDPNIPMIKQEVIRLLLEAIGVLPDRMAEVLRLTLQGYSQEEIAESMGIAVSSVKTMKKNGIGKIRKKYRSLLSH